MTDRHDHDRDHDLALLVRSDPLPTTPADTARIIRAGSRLRRRRHAVLAAGVGLAAGAVVAPFWLLGGQDTAVDPAPADRSAATSGPTTGPTPAPTSIPSPTATDSPTSLAELSPGNQVCGVAACSTRTGPYGSIEKGEVIGTQLEMGTFDGHTEVLYAARNPGHDISTGQPEESVDVVSAGIVVDGRLRRTVWAWQPGEDGTTGPVLLYGAQRTVAEDGSPHFGLFGIIVGEHPEVVASVDGESRPVSGSSTTVYPGYTAFYDTGAWDDGWGAKAEISYGVPGGPSCTPMECGTIG